MNIKMTISYDGTNYHGFQTQPDGNTVQNVIERAIEKITGEKVKIIGSGRTDAGVHAREFVFNFHTVSQIPIERWAMALNSMTPVDITVFDAVVVPEEFHSRRHALRKTYRYSVDRGKFADVFVRHYHFHHPRALNVPAMRQALEYLLGTHDYTSFTNVRSTKESHIRTIFEASLVEEGPFLHLYITGNGFLYNMVRIIMGTLLRVGVGLILPEQMPAILEAKDRSYSGPTAMAHALTLWKVEY